MESNRNYNWIDVSSTTDLIQVTGRARYSLLSCSNCGDVVTNDLSWSHNQRYDWAIDLRCNKCHLSWSVCSLCSLQRSALIGYSLRRHHTQKHASNLTNVNIVADSIIVSSNDGTETTPVYDDVSQNTQVISSQVDAINVNFGNTSSNSFFSYEMEDAVGGGATYLVSRSLTKSEGRMTCIHPFDVTYHMKMAKFARSLSRARREEFAQLIQATSTISKKYYELSDVPNKYLKSVIPSSYSFIDSVYTRGKYAIIDNLPIPKVCNVDQHAYVSLKDCIAHLLGFSPMVGSLLHHHSNYEPNNSSSVANIGESRAVKSIIDRAIQTSNSENVLVLYCFE